MKPADARAVLADPIPAGAYYIAHHDAAPMSAAGEELGYKVVRVDLGACSGKVAGLACLARALRFPDWFGGNWDALSDAIGDLSWLPAPGYVLVIENARAWRAADPDDFDTLLAILNEAAEDWSERGVAFWTLLPVPPDCLAALD